MQDEDTEPYAQALASILRQGGATAEPNTRVHARKILCEGCALEADQADAVIAYALDAGILAERDGQLWPV